MAATDGGKLALLAMVGDLVIAIDASQVFQIRRAVETATRRIESNLYAIDLDGHTVPGWDTGELFGTGNATEAWVIIEVPIDPRIARFGLRVGRCISVQRLPPTLPLPRGLFGVRPSAVTGAFVLPVPEDSTGAPPSGVVLDPRGLLTAGEIAAGVRVGQRRENQRDATP
jgi:hypothetical protein